MSSCRGSGRQVIGSLIIGLSVQPFACLAADPPQTREDIFREVFKRPAPEMPISGYVMVVVDGGNQHKLRAVLKPDEQDILLEGTAVVALLSNRLRADLLQRLERSIDAQGWVSRTAIEEAGVKTSFELRKFEFTMVTEPSTREKSIRYLSGVPQDGSAPNALRPTAASGFLNLNLKAARRKEDYAVASSDQTTVGLATDGAVNLMGVVLEGSAITQSGTAHGFQRGDVRLVYDQPRQALRYSAGDLRYPVIGYQTTVDMGGVGVSRDFSLQPYLRNLQTGQFEFYLERPAEVKVFVNDSLVSTLQLPAGTHDIRGLQPVAGLNDTRLLIEDSAGRRETLNFSFIYSPTLLEQGRNLFSYNLGVRRDASNGRYHYNTGQPVVSASYLEGVSVDTTLGGYVQADPSREIFGLQAIHAFSGATVQVDAATSKSQEGKWDAGGKLTWIRTPDLRRGETVQSQFAIEYLGKEFGTINETTPAQANRFNFYASLAMPVGAGATAQLSAYYTPARNPGSVDAHALIAALTQRLGRSTSASLSLRHRRSGQGEMQTGVFFGITYSFSDSGNNFYAAKEIETDSATLSWNTVRPSNLAMPYAFASSRLGAGQREFTGGAGYWGRQGLAEASHTHSEQRLESGSYVRDESAVRMQTAFVFAAGAMGLTRAVSENFAIVKGKEGLAGTAFRVDPDSHGGSNAESGWLSPAVVGDLANYQLRDLRVEPVNPPLGATPDRLTYSLAPTYKSGFLLELGKELRIIAVGRLIDVQGQPLAHTPIEIRRVGEPGGKPLSTFTGRSGGFQLPDIRPGRYEIRPAGPAQWDSVTVDIPEAPDGLFRIGDVPTNRQR